ncbi:hypothetical protein [Dongia deserti]|uniref:hypothetical protein n=1 Tax=Dongia deserti TaxID=2268030 RepID=UPI000E65432D|nr:hypothetical protein [Dongia deserti]
MRTCNALLALAASTALLLFPVLVWAEESLQADTGATSSATSPKTGKERLSDKASDEQRVNNCKVPPERQGTKTRPNGCPQADRTVPTN